MSTKDERQIIPLATVLQQIAKGVAHQKLSEELADLVVAVGEYQKKGTLTITINVEPTKGTETLTVSTTHAVKAPQATEASIFFFDDSGNLTRHDPRQTEADFRGLGIAKTGESA